MSTLRKPVEIEEGTTIKEVLLYCPRAIRVLLNRRVPASCAHMMIAEAARAAGVAPTALLADLREVVAHSQPRGTTSKRT